MLGAATKHAIYLIIKLLPMVKVNPLNVAYSGLDGKVLKRWVGSDNPLREILLGRFLNRLVQRNITPHFPMIYESFMVQPVQPAAGGAVGAAGRAVGVGRRGEVRKDGFAMEMCHFDFEDYVSKHLVNVADAGTRSQLLRVALIQIVHGLSAAAHHYDFRHNDLHGGNAMMTFITNGVYTYKVGDHYYSVPNAGMCWKMIDFGNGSSNVFGAHDNAAATVHSHAFMDRINSQAGHAMEMCDIVRLLDYVWSVTYQNLIYARLTASELAALNDKRERKAHLDGKAVPTPIPAYTAAQKTALMGLDVDLGNYVTAIRGIAAASAKSGTAARVVAIREGNVQSFDHTAAGFLELVANSGLMRSFFEFLASDYAVSARHGMRVDPATLFDIDAAPFTSGEILTGKEAEHFRVDRLGNLRPI